VPTARAQGGATLVAWTDAQGHVTFNYPRPWSTAPLHDAASDQVLELNSGDGVHFNVYIVRATESPMNGVAGYRARQGKRTDRTYTFKDPVSSSLGGVPAVYLDYQSTSTSNSTDIHTAEVVYASANGWMFAFEYFTDDVVWRRRDDLSGMLGSVTFLR